MVRLLLHRLPQRSVRAGRSGGLRAGPSVGGPQGLPLLPEGFPDENKTDVEDEGFSVLFSTVCVCRVGNGGGVVCVCV